MVVEVQEEVADIQWAVVEEATAAAEEVCDLQLIFLHYFFT